MPSAALYHSHIDMLVIVLYSMYCMRTLFHINTSTVSYITFIFTCPLYHYITVILTPTILVHHFRLSQIHCVIEKTLFQLICGHFVVLYFVIVCVGLCVFSNHFHVDPSWATCFCHLCCCTIGFSRDILNIKVALVTAFPSAPGEQKQEAEYDHT